jgi:hypothetical protein
VFLPDMMLVSAMSTNDLFQSMPQDEQMKGGKKKRREVAKGVCK